MCHALLSDSTLYKLLLEFDRDLAAQARTAGCGCGGALHSADYPRKPRGAPGGLGRDFARRLSLCCAREGCRKRATPASRDSCFTRSSFLDRFIGCTVSLDHSVAARRKTAAILPIHVQMAALCRDAATNSRCARICNYRH